MPDPPTPAADRLPAGYRVRAVRSLLFGRCARQRRPGAAGQRRPHGPSGWSKGDQPGRRGTAGPGPPGPQGGRDPRGRDRGVDQRVQRPRAPASRCGSRRWAPAVGGGGLVLLLAEDQTESRRVEEVRRDFVANTSHELKTPVGALALLAETVEDAADDPEAVRRFAGRMRQEASRLTNLVQDLITLSRIQAAEPVPDPIPVDLDAVVAEALDRCRMKASARGIELAASGPHGAVGARRRGPAGHRAAQPAGERGRLQPGEDPGGRLHPPARRRLGRDQRRRPGHRHPRAGPGADLRALLPGRPGPVAGHRRHRARGWRSSSTSPPPTAARSPSGARKAPGRPSRCGCRCDQEDAAFGGGPVHEIAQSAREAVK